MRVITLIAALSFILPSCWVLRGYKIRKLRITDHEKLASVPIRKGDSAFHFIDATGRPEYTALHEYFDSVMVGSQTVAFLVIRNDSTLYEKYFEGFNKESLLPANSMAKSFTGTLVSIAVDEGKIKSLSEPVTNYIPELLKTDPRYANITLQHLMDMRSGFDLNEGRYDLKDDAVRIGLRPNLKKHLLKIKIAEPPGRLRYQSANTQFLGWVIERATGKRLFTYLEEKLWIPLGMEHDATWNIDSRKHKQVMTSAGINAVARDFAKLGRLYLQQGEWNGRQIIDERWVESVASVDTMQKYNGYKHQWWARQATRIFADSLSASRFRKNTPYTDQVRRAGDNFRVGYRSGAFSAIGFLNQVIYVHPEKNLIIVRIGKRWGSYGAFIRYIYNLGEEL